MPSHRRSRASRRDDETELECDVVVSATSSDDDYDPIDKHYNQYGDENATWGDVCYFMCNRTPIEWTKAILHLLLYFTLLYSLFMGIVLLGTSAQVMGGCATGELLEKTSNPITSVMAGVLATSLFQSSTATNFVLGALVGGNGMSVQQGIYIAMGANVGNTVTNSVIALSHLRSATALERAISGATVNDLFLLLSILIFLPIEIFSNMLRKMTEAMVPDSLSEGYQWKGLIKAMVVPLTNKILVANESFLSDVVSGESCEDAYPTACTNGTKSFDTCQTGLVGCDEESGSCPLLFLDGATQKQDQISGLIGFCIAIALILLSTIGMVILTQGLIANSPPEIVTKFTDFNSYTLILLGCGVTMLFSNSSVLECALTPMVGTGIIELEQMFPWSLGSNLGLSLTSMLTALFSGKAEYLQITLANLFFNLFSIILWYPIPYMRKFPLHGALILGILCRAWRFIPFLYIPFMFIAIPFMVIGIVNLMTSDSTGMFALGVFVLVLILLLILMSCTWWFWRGGRDTFISFFEENYGEEADDDFSIQESYISEASSVGYEVESVISPRRKGAKSGTRRSAKPSGILRNTSMEPDRARRSRRAVGHDSTMDTNVQSRRSRRSNNRQISKKTMSSRRRRREQVDIPPSTGVCCADPFGAGR